MEGEVQNLSLELTLGGPWFAEPYQADTEEPAELTRIRTNFAEFRDYPFEQELEERKCHVSTRLKLSSSFDPWVFNKMLTHTDKNQRLCLRKPWVDKDVLPTMSQLAKDQMAEGRRTWVQVFDSDTLSTHEVEFKKEEGFVFRGSWVKDFVDRRHLVEQDAIGLYWQMDKQRFVFLCSRKGTANRLSTGMIQMIQEGAQKNLVLILLHFMTKIER